MNSGNILGSGSLNSIYVSGTFTINSNNLVNGSIESATDDLQISIGSLEDHFVNGATVVGLDAITNYIEATGCNPDGIGESTIITDSDGDGVPDEYDDYPDDIYRAYNNYFPDEDGVASIVFEDLWPATGDYDFNDLVVAVFGNEITNANNEVVEIDINFDVKAVGAGFQNGFGWQFAGITPNQIEQVSGAVLRQSGESSISLNANGTEQGQDSAVMIVVENLEDVLNRAGGEMFNTVNNGLVGTSDRIEMNILFGETSPISRELIGQQAYNVFLIKKQNRDTEIHLPDRMPTNLMTTELFGTDQDVSDPASGVYFKTATHLPWALIILDDFAYPLETVAIIDAYPNFAAWAQSGGTSFPDWYENPDPSKIWTP
jgi:LruC domain-containing protein